MDFQLEVGFYSTPALPRSVSCPVVALQQNAEPLLANFATHLCPSANSPRYSKPGTPCEPCSVLMKCPEQVPRRVRGQWD